jgi:imidazolonepropionase-like amidohydrolase
MQITFKGQQISISADVLQSKSKGVLQFNGSYYDKLDLFEGNVLLPNGDWAKWSGIKSKSFKDKTKPKPFLIDTSAVNNTQFPNMAYGFKELPEQKAYFIKNATLWTNEAQGIIKNANLLIVNGKIKSVNNRMVTIPNGAVVIDAKGKHVTTGIIDEHSHISISKGVNEGGQAVSAEVSIADVVKSNDINMYRQLAGGVTTSQLLHGSANPIGGQSALIKLKWGYAPQEMLIDSADGFIKFALGENVKQANWGDFNRVRFPQTRMGVEQVFYDAFTRAKLYKKDFETYIGLSDKKKALVDKPRRDLEMDIVLEIIESKRFVTCHSYIQSEINMLMNVADSMGFRINTFTHILEGYKLVDKMKAHGAGGSTFSDWWAYKFEVNEAIPYNAAIMHKGGVLTALNSDDAEMGRRLNQEAAKIVKYGGVSEEDAWKMVTLNPAKLLHVDNILGSLKAGKDADIVIWSDNPLSIKAKVEQTFIDGILFYDKEVNLELHKRDQLDRKRIIKLMLDAKNGGAQTQKPTIKKHKHYHCDTVGE